MEQKLLPNPYMVLPFIMLLMSIASGPVLYRHVWERHYGKVSFLLAIIVALYYFIFLEDWKSILHSVKEYISFISLLGSLYFIAGSILVKVKREATPFANMVFLLIGALLSNIIGTTGASMLLIRPYLKMNKERIQPYHIIFFIFIVGNIGGALTPIGDPPLFLGFLKGVPFFWVFANVWYIWLFVLGMVLLLFFIKDISGYENKTAPESLSGFFRSIEITGKRNILFLGVIIVAVFIDHSVFPWIPDFSYSPVGLRELVMIGTAVYAFRTTKDDILRANEFEFEPIREVALLFMGIFITMLPALQLIAHEAGLLKDSLTAGTFFWASGLLSSILDNAPTYLNFLSAAMGKLGLDINQLQDVLSLVRHHGILLSAISVGAVFFGAMTYIGNGPNFMIKSITERSGLKMPSFVRYIVSYSIPVLIPVFLLTWLIFFNL